MRTTLLREIRKLRFRQLTELVGCPVQVRGFDSVEEDVGHAIGTHLPDAFSLLTTREEMAGSFGKYRFLDLTFHTPKPLLTEADRLRLQDSRGLGFLGQSKGKVAQEAAEPEAAPLAELLSQVDTSKTFLLLFLGTESPEQKHRNWLRRWDSVQGDVQRLIAEADEGMPALFTVEDACLTNSPFIWFQKHFWM